MPVQEFVRLGCFTKWETLCDVTGRVYFFEKFPRYIQAPVCVPPSEENRINGADLAADQPDTVSVEMAAQIKRNRPLSVP